MKDLRQCLAPVSHERRAIGNSAIFYACDLELHFCLISRQLWSTFQAQGWHPHQHLMREWQCVLFYLQPSIVQIHQSLFDPASFWSLADRPMELQLFRR